ncbi:acetyltransferase [Streptomyces virginiae]|uniref:Acetyltransferase n=1 Tax=Streptomyces virginiae TaxID=1961 RepID=A0ABQ3NUH6_STRVG|nr:acetyltransferase [Streptomyces sp. WM6349]KOU94956.1 acetyltransferase [Streptomyces sp. XY593]KOU99165.1 acetyltransferase [Streptomyces sp. XY511]KOV55331.1 acetyltransferase [Streptomyces sp. H036]GGP86911.1 acetyltransferase [Streptomyces virginiae]GLV89656.1 acetyltransferase [Streptomyces lavendulae subsp. lavendulae]
MIQSGPVTPPHITDLPIRALTVDDLHRCADLSEDRGWLREDHKWGLLLAAGNGFGVDAPDGRGLAAACVVTRYGSTSAGPGIAAIGMVLVADRYARQGMGRALMTHVCNDVLKGIPLTLHATPYGRPLYEELGFKTTGRAEMMVGAFREDDASDTHGTARVRPAVADDLPRIVRLDAEVFGADRTHMITRLPAFSDQLLVSEEHGGDGTLTGYAAAWPNMHTHVIGPLIARDTGTAKSLIAALARGTDRVLRTDVDVRHEELLAWLKERGMESVAFNAVMTRDIPDLPGDWTRRWAPLTVAAG